MVRHRETNKIDKCNTNITNFYGLKTYLQNAVSANKMVSKLSEKINASNEEEQMTQRQKRQDMLLSAATSQLHFALSTQSIKGVYNADVIARSLLRTSAKNTPNANNGTTSEANIFYAQSEDEAKGNDDGEQYQIKNANSKSDAVNEVCNSNSDNRYNVVKDQNAVNEAEGVYANNINPSKAYTNDKHKNLNFITNIHKPIDNDNFDDDDDDDDIECVIRANANQR